MTKNELIHQFNNIVGTKGVLTKLTQTAYYRSGFRSGNGAALAVVFPNSILEQWKLIEVCVKANCIIIMQAAKTGLTEGPHQVVINMIGMWLLMANKFNLFNS